MIYECPSLQDVRRWAKDSKRELQSMIEIDYFDNQKCGWFATEWVEGLPAKTFLIHEKKQAKNNLARKIVSFDNILKSIKHDPNFQEIWVSRLKILS